MSGFFTAGLSALTGIRTALDVTGQNIANVNTPGYSRQRADLIPSQPQTTLGNSVGNGVVVDGLTRIYNQFVFDSIVDTTSAQGRLSQLSTYSDRVNNLLADPESGIAPTIQAFFDSVQDATADPSSIELRQAVLGEAEALANRFNRIGDELENIAAEIDRNIGATVDEINALAAEVADLNNRISARQNGPIPPNDLLDQRDLALTRLADLLGIETVEDGDGSVNVIALPGVSLVTSGGANELVAAEDPLNPTRRRLELRSGQTGASSPIDLSSGQLGGLLAARQTIVDNTRDLLGQTALTLATTLNAQSARGLDLAGNFGGEIFAVDGALSARPSDENAGSASLTVTIDDLATFTGDSYELLFNGTSYQAIRQSDGEAVAVTGTGTGADPLQFNGISIVVAGSPAADDRFAVEPTRAAASGIRLAISDAQDLAFAAPVSAAADLGNTGNGAIVINATVDIDDPDLLTASLIEFTSPTTYTVNGAGSFAYVDGDPITLNGTEFTITGSPVAGDTFTLQANTNAFGDNRNALELAGFRDRGVLDNGRTGIVGSYGRIVTDSGIRTRNLQAAVEAQDALRTAAVRQQQEVSGVDLDEEAANLVRFQQAYQAATQLIAISDSLFDSLIGAVRR
ncbi:MAG: flagellar hook-associated protein FlgK [Pseudomonadota bacterium]